MSLKIGIDSYSSIQYFDDNIVDPKSNTVWIAKTEPEKEIYIKWTTRLFDDFGWIGFKVDKINQQLSFPRLYKDKLRCSDKDIPEESLVKLIEIEGTITGDITIIPVLICEKLLKTEGNQDLIDLQESGVEEFEAGSLLFKFNRMFADVVKQTIENTDLWYITAYFFNAVNRVTMRA